MKTRLKERVLTWIQYVRWAWNALSVKISRLNAPVNARIDICESDLLLLFGWQDVINEICTSNDAYASREAKFCKSLVERYREIYKDQRDTLVGKNMQKNFKCSLKNLKLIFLSLAWRNTSFSKYLDNISQDTINLLFNTLKLWRENICEKSFNIFF